MDSYSILDQKNLTSVRPAAMQSTSASRSEASGISAQIAAANAQLTDLQRADLPQTDFPKTGFHRIDPLRTSLPESNPRFPEEDSGHSLAEMAQADLDAALQLLAERALYITGASGAAIALRRGQDNDMLCRASAGSNAPELGALLSMEYGLSGESVRTRQPLRCDDTERDPRVNHDVCRELGIASVVVMPIVREDEVLGVFELLSRKPHAFEERDLSALLRLSEMVEVAVRHALAAKSPIVGAMDTPPPPASSRTSLPEITRPEATTQEPGPPEKPLFWSTAARVKSGSQAKSGTDANTAPPALRNLQKCQACGFPISQGRTYCVECEEKKWRGQRLPQPGAVSAQAQTVALEPQSASRVESKASFVADSATPAAASSATTPVSSTEVQPPAIGEAVSDPLPAALPQLSPESDPAVYTPSPLFLSSALPAESWLSSNIYILSALLVVAAVIAAFVWLR